MVTKDLLTFFIIINLIQGKSILLLALPASFVSSTLTARKDGHLYLRMAKKKEKKEEKSLENYECEHCGMMFRLAVSRNTHEHKCYRRKI